MTAWFDDQPAARERRLERVVDVPEPVLVDRPAGPLDLAGDDVAGETILDLTLPVPAHPAGGGLAALPHRGAFLVERRLRHLVDRGLARLELGAIVCDRLR